MKRKTNTLLIGLGLIMASILISSNYSVESVSAYTASIATNNSIELDITPNGNGTSIHSESINVASDCRAGYNLTIATPEGSNLYKYENNTQSSSTASFTAVDGTSALNSDNNTNKWGYTLTSNPNSSTVFSPLSTTASILKTPSQTASPEADINDTFSINYGAKVDNTVEAGTYQMANNGAIVYYLTMDTTCTQYTVSFNPNGGTGTMDNQGIEAGEPTDLSANTFTAPAFGSSYEDANGDIIAGTANTYWRFNGWNTAIDGTGTPYNNEEEVEDLVGAGSTITLYAQWEALSTMVVNFNTNGMEFEDGTSSNTLGYYHGCVDKYVSQPSYSHTANINDDGTQIDSTKYDNNLATKDVITIPNAESLHVTIKYGTENSYDMLYVFQGEYTGSVRRNMNAGQLAKYMGGNNTTTTVELDIPGDTATFAFYSDSSGQYWGYHATVVGYFDEEPESYTSTTQVCTRSLVEGEYKAPAADSLRTFYGWSEDQSATVADYDSADKVLEDLPGDNGDTKTLYAIWKNKLTINYNANTGTGTVPSQTVVAGGTITLKSNSFTAPGAHKQFKNWNTDPNGSGTSYAASSSFTAPGNVNYNESLTLYAIWEDVYYIAFNANESSVDSSITATGTMTNQAVMRNTATAIKTNQFALTGYLFVGWNTSADGTGTFYGDEKTITNLTSTGNTITLYAVWSNGAYLDTGKDVNRKLKRLAGNSSATYDTEDTTITALVRSNTLPNDFTPSTANTISHSSSPYPIYAWYDSTDTTIYYYSESTRILMNKDSSYLFSKMEALSDLNTISAWDTIKVVNMSNMFYRTGYDVATFTSDLSSWDVSNVTDMSSMFGWNGDNATTWSVGDLSSWNVSGVTNMSGMFQYAGYNATTWSVGDLSSWDTSSVTKMAGTFAGVGGVTTTFALDLSSWDTSNVTTMSRMFSAIGHSATTLTLNLSSWDTSNVTDMSDMFFSAGYNATTWSVSGFSSWDVSNVTDMSGMFLNAYESVAAFNLDLSFWDTSSVTKMSSMFQDVGRNATTFALNLSSWDTSNVTTMSHMFKYAGHKATTWSISGLSAWDTSSVMDMYGMFGDAGSYATNFVLDLSSWDTSGVTTMDSMFYNAGEDATTWSLGDLSSWDTSNVTDMFRMFASAGEDATTWSLGDLSSWDTSNVTDMGQMFHYAGYSTTTWSLGDLSSWDTSSVTSMSSMFQHAGYNATTWSLGDLSSWDTSSVRDMSSMFYCAGYSATTWSIGDLSSWDTSSVTTMYYMFNGAGRSATSFVLDLSSWNTFKVKNMDTMFAGAGRSATTWSIGDLSSWDTSNVTVMSSMFSGAGYSATTWSIGDLSSWNTSSVGNMFSMFSSAGYTSTTWSIGDLSSWDTSSVTRMDNMFANAGYSATTFILNLSSWNTSKVGIISGMFSNAGHSATTWSVTIPKTNDGTATGSIANTASNLYGKTTSITATPDSDRYFTLAE